MFVLSQFSGITPVIATTTAGQPPSGQISGIADLHMIGFSRGSIETRIKNAEKSPTSLMAPVPFISTVLGYDVFDPAEVVPEFIADVGVKRGRRSTTRSCTVARSRSSSSASPSVHSSTSNTPRSCSGASQ